MNKKTVLLIAIILIFLITFVALNLQKKKQPTQVFESKLEVLPISGLAAEARKLEDQGNLIASRKAYQKLVGDYPNTKEVQDWQKKIEEINLKLLFSSVITPQSAEYEIKAGDSLEKVAREHKTTVELIMRSNKLSSDKIFAGRKIKVWNAAFSIVVDKSQNTLILKTDDEIVKTYTVSTGSNNSTPIGTFKIAEKITNPTWYKPGAVIPSGSPENILGSRWLGFDKEGYGIHGTTDPKSLGNQVTAGCVRMSNSDVEELYAIVPKGTEVTIVD